MIIKKIYIGGTFDLFHYGHVNVFKNLKYHLSKESQELGALSKVIVAVNSDDFASSYKRVPIMNQYERLAVVNSCRYVDYAFIMDEYNNQPFFIEENSPDYIVMGPDWQSKDYFKQLCIDQQFLDRIDAEMLFVPYTDDISTTQIIQIDPVFGTETVQEFISTSNSELDWEVEYLGFDIDKAQSDVDLLNPIYEKPYQTSIGSFVQSK